MQMISTSCSCKIITMIEILFLLISFCHISCGMSSRVKTDLQSDYTGENFPKQYLSPEDTVPTASDLEHYIITLQRTVDYFCEEQRTNNDTEINRALGFFMMKAVLKKTILEYEDKLTKSQYNSIRDLTKQADNFLSHFLYFIKLMDDNNDIEYRVTTMLRDDTVLIYSIANFNKGRLSRWLLTNISMHSYVQAMDNVTLPRDKYADISEAMDSFYVSMIESDTCLSHIMYNPEPINLSELRPCLPDPYCRKPLLSSPSVAYSLTHRLLNILMRHQIRRCHIQTEKEDVELMDTLCAFMYREAVYLARRGYFAKDLFLEHIALCGLLGYEEFFRPRWFQKASSWVDEQGCIKETPNFIMNRSRLYAKGGISVNRQKRIRIKFRIALIEDCHSHPMALLLIVLAHAIRHTINFIPV